MADVPRKKTTDQDAVTQAGDKPAWRVSGPGAADFLTAQGGLDRPETDAEKGTNVLRDASLPTVADGRRLEPDLVVPENQKERWIASDPKAGERKPGR